MIESKEWRILRMIGEVLEAEDTLAKATTPDQHHNYAVGVLIAIHAEALKICQEDTK